MMYGEKYYPLFACCSAQNKKINFESTKKMKCVYGIKYTSIYICVYFLFQFLFCPSLCYIIILCHCLLTPFTNTYYMCTTFTMLLWHLLLTTNLVPGTRYPLCRYSVLLYGLKNKLHSV